MNRSILILTLAVFFPSWAQVGFADTIHLYENFFGTGHDDDFLSLLEGQQVVLHFDLNDTNDPVLHPFPTTDEYGYDPATMRMTGGVLEFTFFDDDGDSDTVEISAGYYDGDRLIKRKIYNLGGPWFPEKYVTLQVDLEDEGLLDYLQDGLFDTIVLAPAVCCRTNDIRLEAAGLSVDATPVPIPEASMLLFIGLVALATWRGCLHRDEA